MSKAPKTAAQKADGLRDALSQIEAVHEEDRKAGRPSSYKPTYAEIARQLCENGATDYELGVAFGVTTRTIYRWKHEHEEFCHALKTAKDIADERVERALYHKAIGYSYEAVKIMQHEGKAIVHEYIEHVAPDTTAMIFWLKNRRNGAWSDKQEVEHSGSVSLEAMVLGSMKPKEPEK